MSSGKTLRTVQVYACSPRFVAPARGRTRRVTVDDTAKCDNRAV